MKAFYKVFKVMIYGFFVLCTFSMITFFIRPKGFDLATEIGFPFVFYKSFYLRGNEFLNYSGNVENLVIDYVLFVALVIVVRLFYSAYLKKLFDK